jgi:CRP-like cAMP-binding protein
VEQLIDQPISLDAVIAFLVASPLFAALDAEERADVVRIMEIQRLQKDEEVFHEGDPGDSWYVIYEGQVEVTTAASSGADRRLSVLDIGSGFGEMAMLDGSPRSATVRATGPLTLFRFRRPRFEELLGDGSLGAYKLVLAMAKEMSLRLRRLTRQISEPMGKSSPGADLAPTEVSDLVAQYQVSE